MSTGADSARTIQPGYGSDSRKRIDIHKFFTPIVSG